MVYLDYDEDHHHTFDQETGPVSVGNVPANGGKARTSAMFLRRKCFGIPIVFLGGIVLLAIISIGVIASQTGGDTTSPSSSSSSSSSSKLDKDNKPTPAPTKKTPKPTPHPTLPTKPTPAPSPYPTHETLVAESQWIQMGNDVGGIQSAPDAGLSVGVSGDGKVFAEGAHLAAGREVGSGHVRTYQYMANKNEWHPVGSELQGSKAGNEFGYALDLSRSGRLLAVGAPGAHRTVQGEDVGYFAVYQWNDTLKDWSMKGPEKWGKHHNDRAAHDLCISEDDGIVAIGAPGNNNNNGDEAGEIRVYQYLVNVGTHEGRWIERGQDLKGEAAGDKFGWSVAMSDNGMIVAGGAPYSNDGNSKAGHVRVFAYTTEPGPNDHGNRFHKMSRTITGRDENDHFGYSVALSKDGKIVAAGAPGAPALGKPMVGYVDVYKFDETEIKWHHLGHSIYGEEAFEGFGKSVYLSEDGHTLVVGAPDYKGSRGAIRVFKYQPDTEKWIQIGKDIKGDGEYDFWGAEVAASADGRIIISGGNNLDGLEVGAGHVRAYRGT